jgi:hypothetical protein
MQYHQELRSQENLYLAVKRKRTALFFRITISGVMEFAKDEKFPIKRISQAHGSVH